MIVLVTGATAGFGECITRRFIQQGHKVIATGRRQERLQELKDELGDNLYIAQLDVRNRAAIEEMLASLPAEWCNIDILVNNAGLALGMEPAHKASVEDWETPSYRVWLNVIMVILLTLAQRQVAGRMPVVTFTVRRKRLFVSLA